MGEWGVSNKSGKTVNQWTRSTVTSSTSEARDVWPRLMQTGRPRGVVLTLHCPVPHTSVLGQPECISDILPDPTRQLWV